MFKLHKYTNKYLHKSGVECPKIDYFMFTGFSLCFDIYVCILYLKFKNYKESTLASSTKLVSMGGVQKKTSYKNIYT